MRARHAFLQPTRPIALAMLMCVVLGATQCDQGTLLTASTSPPPSPGIPAALSIFVQPTSVAPGAAIAPGVQVVVQDAHGNTVTNSTVMITLQISRGAGTTGAVLGGSTATAAVDGIATFNNLSLDKAGSAYTLTATATSLTSVTSIPFDVVATVPTVSLQSDPGDWVGQGQTYRYDRRNAIITAQGAGGHLELHVAGDEEWEAGFDMPNGLTALEPGTYSAMNWIGEGRGCGAPPAWFTIDDVSYRSGTLAAIDLRFEQHCEGAPPALHGAIHWDADDPTPPPGPVNPIPGGLWQPAAGATPATDKYVYLVSEYGDPAGQGQTVMYSPANATISLTPSSNNVDIRVDGHTPLLGIGYFQGMASITQLKRGYYPNTTSYPAQNPTKGGLSWSSAGAHPCYALRGWFVVDAVSYVGGTLTALDLRFEQRCDGITPALHGAIHWAQ